MNSSHDTLRVSYDYCRQFSRRAKSNFYLGFFLLSPEKRRAMDALYAFMRYTDDLADAPFPSSDKGLEPPTDRRREQIRIWRESLEIYTAGGGLHADSRTISDARTMDAKTAACRLLPALADAVNRHHLPIDCLRDVIDGVEMDLDRNRYETYADLELYCRRVASAVGVACIHIWGFRGQGAPEGEPALEFARRAGVALQLTNILRDLVADADADRVYLPQEDLCNCGYSVEELKNGVVNEAFRRLMDLEINRARRLYREGYKLFDYLGRDGRRIFGLMTSAYRSLLERISRRPGDVFSRPVKLKKFEQIVLFLSWTLAPSIMAEKQIRGKASDGL